MNSIKLNEYLPLKQGLRPTKAAVISLLPLNEYLPLKQGLRLKPSSLSSATSHLNEYLPLKQGLRRTKFKITVLDISQ